MPWKYSLARAYRLSTKLRTFVQSASEPPISSSSMSLFLFRGFPRNTLEPFSTQPQQNETSRVPLYTIILILPINSTPTAPIPPLPPTTPNLTLPAPPVQCSTQQQQHQHLDVDTCRQTPPLRQTIRLPLQPPHPHLHLPDLQQPPSTNSKWRLPRSRQYGNCVVDVKLKLGVRSEVSSWGFVAQAAGDVVTEYVQWGGGEGWEE